MFGYVKPFIPNLRVKEYEFYKSVYCGLCQSMKAHTGNISRMSLSYDMTFFALIRLAFAKDGYIIRKRRCVAHPFHKRPMMDDSDAITYTAYCSGLLTSQKVDDTLLDEHGIKKAGARLMHPYSEKIKKCSSKKEKEAANAVLTAVDEIHVLEQEKCGEPDRIADVFGKMLGQLLSFGLDEISAKIAYEIGLHTGRWVYLMDAVFDYEDDIKKDAYNPFRYAFTEKSDMDRFRRNTLRGMMTIESDSILHAVNLVSFDGKPLLRACIENIIADGMENALSLAVGKEST